MHFALWSGPWQPLKQLIRLRWQSSKSATLVQPVTWRRLPWPGARPDASPPEASHRHKADKAGGRQTAVGYAVGEETGWAAGSQSSWKSRGERQRSRRWNAGERQSSRETREKARATSTGSKMAFIALLKVHQKLSFLSQSSSASSRSPCQSSASLGMCVFWWWDVEELVITHISPIFCPYGCPCSPAAPEGWSGRDEGMWGIASRVQARGPRASAAPTAAPRAAARTAGQVAAPKVTGTPSPSPQQWPGTACPRSASRNVSTERIQG